jgi:diguanylate cyclase (GGDEF)-like protein
MSIKPAGNLQAVFRKFGGRRLEVIRRGRWPFSSPLTQSLNQRLSLGIFLAILCTALLALAVLTRSVHDFALARQNLHDLQTFRMVLDAANTISAERGPANAVMSEDPAPEGQAAQRLVEFRIRTDAALGRLASPPAAPFGLHQHVIPHELLRDVVDQLSLAREKVDRIATIRRQNLTAQEIQDAIASMFLVSDRFRVIAGLTANELIEHDTGIVGTVLIGQMLADLREYGGRVASHIMAPLMVGEPMPVPNVIDSRRSQGRVLALWDMIGSDAAVYHGETAARMRREVEQQFLAEGLALVDEVIAEGLRDGRYSLSATELTDRFVPKLRPLEAFRQALLDTAIEKFRKARTGALNTLVAVTLVTITVLTVLMVLLVSLRNKIFQPLLEARRAVIGLADDPLMLPLEGRAATEVTHLFEAINTLRGRLKERDILMDQLKSQAEMDPLTLLSNRRALDLFVRDLWEDRVSADDNICLILMDIDRFKTINDTHGHLAGDRVLAGTADLLRTHMRSSDVIARFGGEEFAILLTEDNLSTAISVAEKLRSALQDHCFLTPTGDPLAVTASFGVATGHRRTDTWLALVDSADKALYQAKTNGRNCVCFSREKLLRPTPSIAPDGFEMLAAAKNANNAIG